MFKGKKYLEFSRIAEDRLGRKAFVCKKLIVTSNKYNADGTKKGVTKNGLQD